MPREFERAAGFSGEMLVRIKVIGDCYGKRGVFWAPGQKKWIDEKQAEIGVAAGVYEIIESPEAIPEIKRKKSVR